MKQAAHRLQEWKSVNWWVDPSEQSQYIAKARIFRAFIFFGAWMLKELVDHLAAVTHLPIEIDEIASKIKDMGCQDEIHIFPADCDPTIVRGV